MKVQLSLRSSVLLTRPTSLRPTTFPTRAPTSSRSISSSLPRPFLTTSQTAHHSSCPSCHSPLPPASTALCPSCSNLLPPPPPSASIFELFALEPNYAVDLGVVKKRFLQQQQKVHPDLFSGQGEREGWAKGWSGRVNDGYKVLVDPRARGEYLVSAAHRRGT